METAHYLRFARAIALAAVLPACTGPGEPAPNPPATPGAHDDAGAELADAGATEVEETDADVPFSSGPIVPPELPAGFA